MKAYTPSPSLTLAEAVELACSRLTDFNTRSRRSEFWWFGLAYLIIAKILTGILGFFMSLGVTEIISNLLLFFMYGVTVRRLQDGGHSKWWVIISWIAQAAYSYAFVNSEFLYTLTSVNLDPESIVRALMDPVLLLSSLVLSITALVILVFCLMDGRPEENKYGKSPKYTPAE
jgi:uncharacterized membrane protein YhaH (DUF805 family)